MLREEQNVVDWLRVEEYFAFDPEFSSLLSENNWVGGVDFCILCTPASYSIEALNR